MKRTKTKKSARRTRSTSLRRNAPMRDHAAGTVSNPEAKVGTAVTRSTMASVYRLRAKMEYASGKRVTVNEAIASALAAALKG